VTGEVEYRDDEGALQLALFRYGVIAPVVERDRLDAGEVTRLVASIANTTHYQPHKGPVRYEVRTIYRWMQLYRQGGMAALRPRSRRDRGTSRKIDDAVLARAVELRKEGPKRWTMTLIDILRLEKKIQGEGKFHRATLDRHLDRVGASRRQLRVLDDRVTIRMEFEHAGALWVGDFHHGPLVLAPDGRLVTAKLSAFIDHATRYPVADRYYIDEGLTSLRHCLLCAVLRWGPAKKVYVDRGSVYRAEQLAYSLDRLGSKLIHSRAYYSQGRGVIERWWQVIGQFEDEVRLYQEPLTLHELNRAWEAYRELRYCQAVHSAIGKTPAQAIEGVVPRPLDPEVVRELFLVREMRTVHHKDSCVPVFGRRYLVDRSLRKRRVVVRFDPSDLSSVLIFYKGERIGRAFPQQPNARPEPHRETEAPRPPSVDYLALLREEYDRKLLEHARPLAYADLRVEAGFDAARFVTTISALAGLEPARPALRQELEAFWETFGPLPEELVRIGTEHAVRLHGRGRHQRVYLGAIRTLVLAHWHGRASKDSKE
jgi:transposase InsO family protein